MTTTSSERRLHPASILFTVLLRLPSFIVPVGALIVAAWNRDSALIILSGVAGLLVLTAVIATIGYFRFSYRYDERDLVVRSGVFTRNERTIPYVRIQNLDAAQNLLQQMAGVVVVYVQTGGGTEPEAVFRVLPLPALEEMRARVVAAGGSVGDVAVAATPALTPADIEATPAHTADVSVPRTRRTLLALSPRELLLTGFIENRGVVLIAGAVAVLEQTGIIQGLIERIGETDNAVFAGIAAQWLGESGMPLVVRALYVVTALLVLLLFIRALSTVWAVIRLYGFRLDRVGDDLHTEFGLFTRVSATIPLRRVQTIVLSASPLHRLLGRRRVGVETAGGIVLDNTAPKREPIAPLLRVEALPALLDEIQPGLTLDDLDWQPVHPRAFGRMVRGSLFWPLFLTAVSWFFMQAWALAVLAGSLLLVVLHARLRSQHLAWALTPDSIIVRDGAFRHTTRIARFNRIQVTTLHRNPFDVRTGMARVHPDTAGSYSGTAIPYMPDPDAVALHRELVSRAADAPFWW